MTSENDLPAVRGTRAPLLISPWGRVRWSIKHACHPKGVPGFPSSQIHTVWLPTTYSQRVSSDGCRQPKIRKLWTPKTKDTARANPKSDPRKRTAVCQRVIPPKITGVPLLQPKLQVGSFFLRLLCVSGRGGGPLSDRVCHRSVVLAEWSAKTQKHFG